MKIIARISESKLKFYRKLLQKKYRQQERRFLVEGVHLVEEALSSGWCVEALLMTESFLAKSQSKKMFRLAEQKRIEVFRLTEREFASISDTVAPQGVMAIVAMPSTSFEQFLGRLPPIFLVVALENISDPGNVGTILRTCDWFGVDAVILDRDCVETYNPKVIRASMGAVFHVQTVDDVDLCDVIRQMKNKKATIAATGVGEGTAIQLLETNKRMILVFGNEAHGVSKVIQDMADEIVTIPKFGKAESLNVGTACGVMVGYLRLKR